MSEPRRALVVIDVQREYFEGPLAIAYPPRDEVLATIVDAIGTATDAGVPVALVQHESSATSPVFAAGSERQRLHPEIDSQSGLPRFTKNHASVFTSEALRDWVAGQSADTVTLVGFMTNNCVLATAADAETRGLAVEVLRDATGAIALSNAAGTVTGREVHDILMVLLHSNWARVATAAEWAGAVKERRRLDGGNLIDSAAGERR